MTGLADEEGTEAGKRLRMVGRRRVVGFDEEPADDVLTDTALAAALELVCGARRGVRSEV